MLELDFIFDPNNYRVATELLPRLLGIIYFFVYGALFFQVKGLYCSQGILPIAFFHGIIKQRLSKKRTYYVPSLFWLNSSDHMIMGAMYVGIAASLFLMMGIAPSLMLLLLFTLHLSVVASGQEFLRFGWELLLLEITFNTFFLSLTPAPNLFILISLNFTLFRFYFLAGASKLLSKDKNWAAFTALHYHYQTQPLPNTIAWYAHHLPGWFHRLSVAAMFFVELIAPFGIFGSSLLRLCTFFLFNFLQIGIWATGNLSYLNYLSVIFSVILVNDSYFHVIGINPAALIEPSLLQIPLSLIGLGLIFFQIISLYNYFFPNGTCAKILSWIEPFHIVNRYGIFAVMTTVRNEIIIEGSNDRENWKEYYFKYKPSELERRPRRISPYQPRLDWQMWFLPFSRFENEWWFQRFLICLLQGKADVLKLMRHNPFPKAPPKFIRALIYEYRFTDSSTKSSLGTWWERKYVAAYSPIMTLTPEKDREV